MSGHLGHVKGGMGPHEKPTRDSGDEELVDYFLSAVSGTTNAEAASRANGVAEKDVSRWRNGKWKSLSEPKAYALRRFRETNAGNGPDRFQEGVAFALQEIDKLRARLGAVTTAPLSDDDQRVLDESVEFHGRMVAEEEQDPPRTEGGEAG